MIRRIKARIQLWLDNEFLRTDRRNILRSRNIRRIPGILNRRGGKVSYAEWAHVAGIFQTLIYQNLGKKTGNRILDIGCGTGLLAIASEPFVSDGGLYTGIDVMEADINFCRRHYPSPPFRFIHFDLANPTYAAGQDPESKPWPMDDESVDMVTALSVWTHLAEQQASYYFKEIARVLRPGGKAIISFFYLDDKYKESLSNRSESEGRYHTTSQALWVFDQPAYESADWFSPKWIKDFEDAIGVTPEGIDRLLKESGLTLKEYFPGNWKEMPGVYFQDVLVFAKT